MLQKGPTEWTIKSGGPMPDFGPPTVFGILFCEYINVTEDKKRNLIGVFDRLFVSKLPEQLPPFYVFAKANKVSPGGIDLVVKNPQNEEIVRGRFGEDDTEAGNFALAIRTSFPVKEAGIYWIELEHRDGLLGRSPLSIELKPEDH